METFEGRYGALFSVPRSGSSWIGKIVGSSPEVEYRYQPSFAYSFPYSLDQGSSFQSIAEFCQALLDSKDQFIRGGLTGDGTVGKYEEQAQRAKFLFWKEVHNMFMASALLERSDAKVVGLIRNPLAVLHSWRNATKEFLPGWDFTEEWRKAQSKNQGDPKNFFGFDQWKKAAKFFHDIKGEYSDRVFLIDYSSMIESPIEKSRELLDFLELDWTNNTESFILKTTEKEEEGTYSVYKKRTKDEGWKGHIPEEIVDEISGELKGTELQRYL